MVKVQLFVITSECEILWMSEERSDSPARQRKSSYRSTNPWHHQQNLLSHHPYSSDLTHSDFHLFSPLIEALSGNKFQDNELVKKFMRYWLKCHDKEFFAAGIKKLVNRWKYCINVQRDYEQKYCFVKINGFSSRPICSFIIERPLNITDNPE